MPVAMDILSGGYRMLFMVGSLIFDSLTLVTSTFKLSHIAPDLSAALWQEVALPESDRASMLDCKVR